MRVGWSPALHTNLLVVEDARLRATPRETSLSPAALQLWSGVRGAGRRGSTQLREANLFVREVEGLRRRLGGQRHRGGRRQAGEGGRPGEALGEAGAALHAREAELRVGDAAALDAASAVAPPLLHGRPHARALGAPGGAAAGELI